MLRKRRQHSSSIEWLHRKGASVPRRTDFLLLFSARPAVFVKCGPKTGSAIFCILMHVLTNAISMSEMKECIDRVVHSNARAPISTYRVQMHAQFTFSDAQKILLYLKQLGIGDLYSSPIFEARPGSQHGYDVIRHDRLNSELGGEDGFNSLCDALRNANMGLLLDIVPNHMGIGNNSVWWQDVLLNGRSSEYATFFDIDWEPIKPDMHGKLLLPILGKQYGEELESKKIQVSFEDGYA